MKIKNVSIVSTPYYKGELTEVRTDHEFINGDNEWYWEQFFLNEKAEVVAKFIQYSSEDYQGVAEQLSQYRQDIFAVIRKAPNIRTNDDGLVEIVQVVGEKYHILHEYSYYESGEEDKTFIVKKDGLYGYIDTDGVEIIKPQYCSAKRFSNGIAIVNKDGFVGAINKKNEVVVPFEYIRSDNSVFVDGYCAFELPMNNGVCIWHILNSEGEIVFENKGQLKNLGFGNFLVENGFNNYEIMKLKDNEQNK